MIDSTEILKDIISMTMYVSLPALLAGLLVGVFMGVLQATTQIQEAALGFVPKLIAVLFTIYFTFNWSAEKL
jgi:flagellar biosynthetic protein FliQ